MFQSFPASRQELRVYQTTAAAGVVDLDTVLNVSGQPRACSIVGVIAAQGSGSISYDYGGGGANHYVAIADAAATQVRSYDPPFPLPMSMRRADGTMSNSTELVTVGATIDVSVLYLVNLDELVP